MSQAFLLQSHSLFFYSFFSVWNGFVLTYRVWSICIFEHMKYFSLPIKNTALLYFCVLA